MKNLRLPLLFIFPLLSFVAHSAQLSLLDSSRSLRRSQSFLNWHIKNKLRTGQDLIKVDYCLIKVEGDGEARIEGFKQACPENVDQAALANFRSQARRVNEFLLSPRLSSLAAPELKNLKDAYAAELPQVNARYLDDIDENAAADSLGQIIFMSLNGKKLSVGHLDAKNNLLDLCSGAWADLCYFDFRSQAFNLGYERTLESDNDTGVPRNNWEEPKAYEDFVEIVAAGVFTRGNDDSRDQIYYTLSLADGKKVPISEEWYLYFFQNPATRGRVAKSTEVSHRTRNEWNYLTAIHPVSVIKVRNRETNETRYKIFMGASVFYRNDLNIEEADCDLSETEGFKLVALRKFATTAALLNPGYYSDFEQKMLYQSIGEVLFDQPDGDLQKVYDAYYINPKRSDALFPLSQRKYLPNTYSLPGLNLFGMNGRKDLGESLEEEAFAVIKPAEGLMPPENGFQWPQNPANIYLINTQFSQNMLKEYLSLERDGQGYQIKLYGFNPNDFISTNLAVARFPRSPEALHYDTDAIHTVWTSATNEFQRTHIYSRAVSEQLKKLKVALNVKRYRDQRSDGVRPANRFAEVVAALEAGQALPKEALDQFIGDMDNSYRFVGKNVYKALGVKGRNNHFQDLLNASEWSIVGPLKEATWKFPSRYLLPKTHWDREAQQNVVESEQILELNPADIKYLQDFLQRTKRLKDLGSILIEDHHNMSQWLLRDPQALTRITQDQEVLTKVAKTLRALLDQGGGYFASMRELYEVAQRGALITVSQRNEVRDLVRNNASYRVLRPYFGTGTVNAKLLLEDSNQSYLDATDKESLRASTTKAQALKTAADALFEEVQVATVGGVGFR